MRRTLAAQFKFKAAVEALKGIRSINEIAAENQVHPTQVAARKKELREGGSSLFERKNARNRQKTPAAPPWAPETPKYPYLLRKRAVTRPDEVWPTDITYHPWANGTVYLTFILD